MTVDQCKDTCEALRQVTLTQQELARTVATLADRVTRMEVQQMAIQDACKDVREVRERLARSEQDRVALHDDITGLVNGMRWTVGLLVPTMLGVLTLILRLIETGR